MPRFDYVTQTAKGNPYLRASAEAASLTELSARLISQNKPVIRIEQSALPIRTRTSGRISLRHKLILIEQLEASAFLGMDLRTALTICLNSTSPKRPGTQRLRAVIAELRERVSRGTSFSRAISFYPEVFDEVAAGFIRAGEEGGTLSQAFSDVRKIWSRNEELGHRLLMMLIYPCVVLVAAVGVVWLLMAKVVPQFISVLQDLKTELPWPTRLLVQISPLFAEHPVILLVAVSLLILALTQLPRLVRRTPWLHGYLLKIPIFGKLNLLLIQANFSRTFAQLKHARAKTTQALLLCRDLSWNYEYKSAVARTIVRVHRGESLARALADDADIFGELIITCLAFMEASGAGGDGLFRLTTLLERQLDSYLNALRQILDPLLILLLGLIIGGIVFATFLPAIQILQNI